GRRRLRLCHPPGPSMLGAMLFGGFGDLLLTYGLLAIFLVMLVKEAGVPVPIPSDLIMITAGVQVGTGVLSLLDLTLALLLAIVIGGTVQFFIVRGVGRP